MTQPVQVSPRVVAADHRGAAVLGELALDSGQQPCLATPRCNDDWCIVLHRRHASIRVIHPADKADADRPRGRRRVGTPPKGLSLHGCSQFDVPSRTHLRARKAAHARWSKHSSAEHAKKMRDGLWEKFCDQVDPDRTLPEDERYRRAEHARKAFYADLAYRSASARSLKAGGGDDAP